MSEPAAAASPVAGQALAAAVAHGVTTMFTLSGGHVFPLYDAVVRGGAPVRLVDVRHEQSAVFAAEAFARLTRTPGLAVLTAGPGVTNGVSALTTAHVNGSPLVVLGGRAPDARWGSGALQELDHPLVVGPVTKAAWTEHDPQQVGRRVAAAFTLATTPHRGPVFLDLPVDVLFANAAAPPATVAAPEPAGPDPQAVALVAARLAAAHRPVLVVGSDVWTGGAEEAARRLAEELDLPVIANGMGRGVLPRGHRLLVTRARSEAFARADLVVVAGAPLDFRLGFGRFGPADAPAAVVQLADAADRIATHVPLAGAVAGDLAGTFELLTAAWESSPAPVARPEWAEELAAAARAAEADDARLMAAESALLHPARVLGELARRLDDDAVVIGDGGDFVSFAGRLLQPQRAGCWLDAGAYGCLGTGLGYAIGARLARPHAQVVLLLGDGAAGFSLMDVDTLVRHRLAVVVLIANNSCWAMEKHPMQALYGYDVLADLGPRTGYDAVARALGAGGETVQRAAELGPALDRAFAAGVPYVLNVLTDPAVAYPRSTSGV